MTVCKAEMSDDKRINTVLGRPTTYRMLNKPNNAHCIGLIFASARKSHNETAIVNIYRAYSLFLAHIIRDMATVKPLDLVAHLQQQNNMLYKDIISLGAYHKIIEEMAARVYRKLESRRSDSDMLGALIKTFDLSISDEMLSETQLYLTIRHLIIHNKGYADSDFIAVNANRIKLDSSKRIRMTYKLASKMSVVVYRFVKTLYNEIDSKVLNP